MRKKGLTVTTPAQTLLDDTDQTRGAAWKRRDDAERDAWLEAHGIEVWRVRRENWDPVPLAADLRRRSG